MEENNNNSVKKLSLSTAVDPLSPRKRKITLTLEISLAEDRDDLQGATVSIIEDTASEREIVGAVQESVDVALMSAAAIVVQKPAAAEPEIEPAPTPGVAAIQEPVAAEPQIESAPTQVVDVIQESVAAATFMSAAKPEIEPTPKPAKVAKTEVQCCGGEEEFRRGLMGKRRYSSDTATSSDVENESDCETDSTRDDDPADWTVTTFELVHSPSDTINDSFDERHRPGISREQ